MAIKSTLLRWDKDLQNYLQQGPSLSQEEMSLCREASDLLEKARSRSSTIIKESEEEFERQKKLGFEQGLQEGREAALAHNVKTVLASLEYYEDSRKQLVDIVISCLRRLVMDLPREEQFYQLVGQALDIVKQQPRIVLQINPKDHDVIEAAIVRLQPHMPSGSKIEVRMHEELKPGSCVLESPLGLVDASLESQLAILEHTLLNAAKE